MGTAARWRPVAGWIVAPLVALALAAVAWGTVPGGTFQLDDFHNVVRDPATTDAAALARRLAVGVRPLSRLSYFADAWRRGLEPGPFLATNLVLHLTTVLAVYALARRRLGTPLGGSLAALAFALQPAHAETVAYVSGRSTGLMAALLLWGLVCHDAATTAGGTSRGRRLRAASLGLFAGAALAKEVALVAPLLVWLWEWTRPGAAPGRRAARAAVLPAAGAAVAVLLLAASPRYRYLAQFSLDLRDPWTSLVTNVSALPGLLSLWGRPDALSVVHPFALPPRAVDVAAGAGVAVGLALLAVAGRRRAPLAALAGGWVLAALAPTHSLVARLEIMTEKPLYLAWVGPALLLGAAGAWAVRAAAAPSGGRALAAGLALAVALLVPAAAVRARVHVWADPARLWSDAVHKAPGSSRAWTNLGVAHLGRREDRAAASAFRQALALDPGNGRARVNLAITRLLCGAGCEEEG